MDEIAVNGHSHITGKILLYTTTRRKIPNILGNWHMKFNSPLLKLSYMMLNNRELINSPHVGNWNCLYCGEIKSCYINSPHVEDWNSKFCDSWGILFFTTCGFATTWWKIQSLFLLGKGLGQSCLELRNFQNCTCRVSKAKFYLYHSTKIAKAGPGFDEIP